jgi:hypothetical protein
MLKVIAVAALAVSVNSDDLKVHIPFGSTSPLR